MTTDEQLATIFGAAAVALVILYLLQLPKGGGEPETDWPDEFLAKAKKVTIKDNHTAKVVVSQAYYWEPIETAPLGCKVQLKTKLGGVAIYGSVTEGNRNQFSSWAPLPTTRKDKK